MTGVRKYARKLAHGIIVSRLDIGFELSNAYAARTGWRVRPNTANLRTIEDMRALGLVEALGAEPTAPRVAGGLGYHLTAFGMIVRREMLERQS